ncbi:PTS glucitol/sorbitol transporter subunit IIA [Streptococcus cameli]
MQEFTVVEIGEMVPAFEEELIVILFGETAPPELRAISVVHDYKASNPDEVVLKVGTKLQFGSYEYTVVEAGSAANANFQELGHVAIYMKKGDEELLPGSIIVEPSVFPQLNPGDTMKIINN